MRKLPAAVEDLLNSALVAELTVVAENGYPVTHPLIPLYDGDKIYLTSSVLFPTKLDRIKANPRVSVSISDPVSVATTTFHRATIQGDAVIDDADLHSGWERVLPLWRAKEPSIDFFLGKRVALPLFFERAVIEVTPRRVIFWEEGDTDKPPETINLAGAAK
jgi:general stress protein 26